MPGMVFSITAKASNVHVSAIGFQSSGCGVLDVDLRRANFVGYATSGQVGLASNWSPICTLGAVVCVGLNPNVVIGGCVGVVIPPGGILSFLLRPSILPFAVSPGLGFSINDLYVENDDLSIHVSYGLLADYTPDLANVYVPNLEVVYYITSV